MSNFTGNDIPKLPTFSWPDKHIKSLFEKKSHGSSNMIISTENDKLLFLVLFLSGFLLNI